MKDMKLTRIAFAICFLLLGVLNSSDASEITYMYVHAEADYGSGANATAYVNTDEDIVCIKWFVDDVYSHTTHYGDNTHFASEIFTFTGNIKGNKHKITAQAWLDPDVCMPAIPKSYTFRVFQPKIISGTKYPRGMPAHQRGTGISGYVELSRHYHDGQNIVVDGYMYARNRTKTTCHAVSWFRHTEYDANGFPTGWQRDDPPLDAPNPGKRLLPGKAYSDYGSSSISYWVGGDIGEKERIILNAHIHLSVAGLVWHEVGGAWTHTFTKEDNQ